MYQNPDDRDLYNQKRKPGIRLSPSIHLSPAMIVVVAVIFCAAILLIYLRGTSVETKEAPGKFSQNITKPLVDGLSHERPISEKRISGKDRAFPGASKNVDRVLSTESLPKMMPSVASTGRTATPSDESDSNGLPSSSQPIKNPAEASAFKPEPDGLTIQVASFRFKKNARRLLKTLQKQGYNDVSISATDVSGRGTRYRVRVGQFESRKAAEATVGKLKDANYDTLVVSF